MTTTPQRPTTQARCLSGQGGHSDHGDDDGHHDDEGNARDDRNDRHTILCGQLLPPGWIDSVEASVAAGPRLTKRQAQVLALLDCQPQPTLRELALAMTDGDNRSGMLCHLRALERKGFIRRDKDSYGGGRYSTRAAVIIRRNDGSRILYAGQWFAWTREPPVAPPVTTPAEVAT